MQAADRPVLHLNGPRLSRAFEALIDGAERAGGIEALAQAARAKSALFAEAFAPGGTCPDEAEFRALCAFMAPVRRRVGPWLAANSYAALREAVGLLVADGRDTGTTDARIERFTARFPRDRAHRWVRDLAAEVLHNTWPELYPLMNRWVWDNGANTGVLREIWHAADDTASIDVADSYATFVVLREELAEFLSRNGVFRDVLAYVDMLSAQVYAEYVTTQGASFLRAEFNEPDDPLAHARRMLGLDGIERGLVRQDRAAAIALLNG